MRYITLLATVVICGAASGYSSSFFNLYSPVPEMEAGSIEFSMNHRFFGNALKDDPFNSLFGMDDGANVRFGTSYFITEGINLGLSHTRIGHTNTLYSSWNGKVSTTGVKLGALLGYSSVKPGSLSDREGVFFTTLSISAISPCKMLKPAVNYIIDGYEDESGFGFGMEVQATERISVIGEYFPYPGEEEMNDTFAFGGRYNTWGHQFLLGFTNSSGIGPQAQLQGSPDNDLSLTLSIRRLF